MSSLREFRDQHKSAVSLAVIFAGLYIAAQLIADVSAVKLLQTPFGVIPGGTYIFAITFTLRDMLHRRAGKSVALTAVYVGVIANIGLVLYNWFVIASPSAPFWQSQAAFVEVFSVVPLITLASIAAEAVSETIDTYIYEAIYRKSRGWAMVFSNTVGTLVDSAIFMTIAFWGQPILTMVNMVLSTGMFKVAVSVLSAVIVWVLSNTNGKENGHAIA